MGVSPSENGSKGLLREKKIISDRTGGDKRGKTTFILITLTSTKAQIKRFLGRNLKVTFDLLLKII